nr:MAG TPA: hypothetical protein [Caudoviricetes sp.]
MAKRIKQRAGIPKRAQKRFIINILRYGNIVEDYKKYPDLYTYLTSISKEGYDIRVYKGYILVMSADNDILRVGVTLLKVPREYYHQIRRERYGQTRRNQYKKRVTKRQLSEDNCEQGYWRKNGRKRHRTNLNRV